MLTYSVGKNTQAQGKLNQVKYVRTVAPLYQSYKHTRIERHSY